MSWICGSDDADEGPTIPILAGLDEGLTPPLHFCLLSTAVNGYHVSHPAGYDAKGLGDGEFDLFVGGDKSIRPIQNSTTAASSMHIKTIFYPPSISLLHRTHILPVESR